ncbi:hypothetical protein Pth03_30670 [Planotetraspora thailandica]|uniref:Uncharacterized protein n=1 Tax=Planotetraspora thailandica TaxID=487172 RepID=A0A8J3XYM9_9ACTN|nr:hypothetical protein Pth03_30670 [Planotetraspora thailandica]
MLAYDDPKKFPDVEALYQMLQSKDFGLGKDGYQALASTDMVIVENRSHDDIALVGIAFKILTRKDPPKGTAVWLNPQANDKVIELGFDLDSFNSHARSINPDGTLGEDYFAHNRVVLKPGEQIAISMRGDATRFLNFWRAEISVYIDGSVRQVMAPAADKPPFATTGLANTFGSAFDIAGGHIKQVAPRLFCARHVKCGPRDSWK